MSQMSTSSASDRTALVDRIQQVGLVAIIRANADTGLIETCRALSAGGASIMEITMTTPGALEAIATASRELSEEEGDEEGGCVIGVGSVLDADTANRAIDAGARFVVSPVFKPEVIDAAHARGCPVFAGALTPTEILAAFEAGSDVVKVFPANHFGPKYFKDVLAPMPHLKLTPTGGVDLDTVADWFDAGAVCLGVGSALVKKDLIAKGDWTGLTRLAERFVQRVEAARS